MNIPDAIFPPHGTISTTEKRCACSNVGLLCTTCDILTLHCTSLVVVVYDSLLWSPYGIGQTIIFSSYRLLWSPFIIGQTIIFLPCDFYLSFFFPRLISAAVDWMSTILHTLCGLSANLRCRSETCCMWLAGNAGCKKVAKNRHLGTIAQLCPAICLQLRHVSTIGKKFC